MDEPTKPARPRRWWRYSLRTLLVLFTLTAIWLGALADRAIKQRRAVDVTLRLGGRVNYRHQRDGDRLRPDQQPWAPEWLRNTIGDDFFTSLDRIIIGKAEGGLRQVSDEDLAAIGAVSSLRELSLWDCSITDSQLASLANLQQLELFQSNSPLVTNEGLKHLLPLKRLKFLALDNIAVKDDGLAALATMPGLEILAVNHGQFTDAGMQHLLAMPKLRQVSLADSPITDQGLTTLAGLSRLEAVVLNGTQVTDAGLSELSVLPNLLAIELNRTSVTGTGLANITTLSRLTANDSQFNDEGLRAIAQMHRLHSLELDSSKITDAGLSTFDGLPQLETLRMCNTAVTDLIWPHLKGPRRRRVYLEGTQTTEAAADVFRKASGCRVYTNNHPQGR
jgi:hypothetical protein